MHMERVKECQTRMGIAGVVQVGFPFAMAFSRKLCVSGYDSDLHRMNLPR